MYIVHVHYQRQTLVSPCVGITQTQDGGSNGCTNSYNGILLHVHVGVGVTHFEALFSPFKQEFIWGASSTLGK